MSSMSSTDWLPLVAVALATLAASATDLWKFKVYNVLTIPTLLAGLVVSTWLGGWGGLASSLLGAGLGFGLLVVFFAAGGRWGGGRQAPDGGRGLARALPDLSGLRRLGPVRRALCRWSWCWPGRGSLGLAVELIAARRALLEPGLLEAAGLDDRGRGPAARPSTAAGAVRRDDLPRASSRRWRGGAATSTGSGRPMIATAAASTAPVGPRARSRGDPMNVRTMIVGVLAVVCGLSAMVLVQAIRKPPSGPVIEKVPVVFAAADIKPGETIQEAMLEVREIPKTEVPEDAILKVADAVDRAAMTQLDKGDLLREKKLAEKGAGRGMAALIKTGMRAFTIQTPSFSSSLAGFLLPGNKVDVLLTVNSSGGAEDESGGASTTTLLQNVEILAVHTTVNTPTANKIDPDQARSVTLLVTPEDASLLDLGQNKGTLHLSLRNLKDTGSIKPKPTTLADLQLPRTTKPKPAVAVEPPAPPPARRRSCRPSSSPGAGARARSSSAVRTLRGTAAGEDVLTIIRPDVAGRRSPAVRPRQAAAPGPARTRRRVGRAAPLRARRRPAESIGRDRLGEDDPATGSDRIKGI